MHLTDMFEVHEPNLRRTARSGRIMTQLRAQYPQAQTDSEALLYHFRDGQRRDRADITRLDTELDTDEVEIDRIQRDIDRLKQRQEIRESQRQRLVEALVLRDPVYQTWHRVAQQITEAAMSEPEILALFGNIEQNLNQGGSNRTRIGRGKDTAVAATQAVSQALNSIWQSVQRSTPVAAVDTAYDQATDAIARLGGGENSPVMQAIRRYREMVRANPRLAGFAKAALVAAAGLATGGAGLPAIAGLTYGIDSAIRGDKLSSVIGKGAGAALLAWAAQSLISGDTAAQEDPSRPGRVQEPTDLGPPTGSDTGEVPGVTTKPGDIPQSTAPTATAPAPDSGIRFPPGTFTGGDTGVGGSIQAPTTTAPTAQVPLDVPGPAPQMPTGLDGYVRDASGELVRSSDGAPVRSGFAGVTPQEYTQAIQGLTPQQIQALGGADPTDPFIRSRLGLPPLREGVFVVREWDSRKSLDHARNSRLRESRRSRQLYITESGVDHIFHEIQRCQDHACKRALRLLEYVRSQPQTDLLRPDMPDAPVPQSGRRPGLGSRIGSALQTFGRQLTRRVTQEKLKMNWHQQGKPTDSAAIAQFLLTQGVPQDVISGVYQQLGLPVPAAPSNQTMAQLQARQAQLQAQQSQAQQSQAAAGGAGAAPARQSADEFARDLTKTFQDFSAQGGSVGAPAVKAALRDMWMQAGGTQIQEQATGGANELAQQLRDRWNQFVKSGGNIGAPAVKRALKDLWMQTGGTRAVESQHDMAEEVQKDACYHKVKSRYKVWPSAYASGALVQCRKRGADNWGKSG